jgi:hypothetical protein
MSKKDISKILTEGTPRQRLMILAEHIARDRFEFKHPDLQGKEPLLTEKEFNSLSDSFKTSQEVKLYNKWREYDRTVVNSITNLQGLRFEVMRDYSNLRGYILVWNSIENAELLVNSVLHEIKDTKERNRIAKAGAEGIRLLFSKTTTDEEGYIDIKIDFEKDTYQDENGKYIDLKEKPKKTKEFSLWYVMNNVKNQATASAITFISWRKAILDYMEETGFNVKTYKDMIKVLSEEVYSPIIGWDKYLSEEDKFNPGTPHQRLDKLKSYYAITPIISELEVDEEKYNHYRKNFLKDE